MAENSNIEWTDHTFNPWIGCTKVSPACDNCYAETWAKRFGTAEWGTGKDRVKTKPANWEKPIRWNAEAAKNGKRYRVFCASLADVFDNEVDPAWRNELLDLIEATPNLDWLLLTKRIGNVRKMLGSAELPDNVWLGISVVNQEEAARDIPKLIGIKAKVRFLSMEPLLGPVELRALKVDHDGRMNALLHDRIQWVIVGGESGTNARPMHPQWALDLRDQCAEFNVPFLFKQWGEWMPWIPMNGNPGGHKIQHVMENGSDYYPGNFSSSLQSMIKAGKKVAGRMLNCRTEDGVPHGY